MRDGLLCNVLAACLAVLVAGACSSNSKPGADAAGATEVGPDTAGDDGGPDTAGDDGGPDGSPSDATEVGATALTCQGIRLCWTGGGNSTDCASRGTPDGKAAFQTLFDCLMSHCSDLVASCICREACQQPDGYCLDQTDACLAASGTSVDAVCGQFCGG